MSHIIEFTISRLAGRKGNYSRKLNEDVNIFFGLNGSGKTSLLKILHFAMCGDTEVLRNVPFRGAHVTLYPTYLQQELICTFHQMYLLPDRSFAFGEALYPDNSDNTPESTEREVFFSQQSNRHVSLTVSPYLANFKGLHHAYLPISRYYLSKRPKRLPLSETQLDVMLASYLQELWVRHSANTLGSIRKIQGDGLTNILKTILSATEPNNIVSSVDQPIDIEIIYEQMLSFLKRQENSINISIAEILGSREDFVHRYEKDARLQKVVHELNTIEKEIEQAMTPRQNLQKLVQKMFSHKQIEFTDSEIVVKNEDNDSLGLHLLSSGERQLMLIFLETFLAGDNPILIDEPEMSMHIDWQEDLVSALRQLNPEAQLILTTHAPSIMANVADDKIFRLNYE